MLNPKPTLLPRGPNMWSGDGQPGQGPWHMRKKVVPQFRIAKLVNVIFHRQSLDYQRVSRISRTKIGRSMFKKYVCNLQKISLQPAKLTNYTTKQQYSC